ncbi:hypothetical protein SteCoe_38478 [Stentor coeruleus]|uniref:Uncharacterized protein n=1 Tax=Stentor coeruleus TaxID=5963 RepID=A0A1R2ALD7_9CILI|nr:hypothetical protein SteCoe_38478 [Stentor coeruleus]
MNNLNFGLALGFSGLVLNYATTYGKGAMRVFTHTRSKSIPSSQDLSENFSFYASCDDVYDLSELLSEESDIKI